MIFIMDSQVVLPQVTNDTGLIYINSKLNKLPPFAFNYVFLLFLRGTETFRIIYKAFISNTDFLSNLTKVWATGRTMQKENWRFSNAIQGKLPVPSGDLGSMGLRT